MDPANTMHDPFVTHEAVRDTRKICVFVIAKHIRETHVLSFRLNSTITRARSQTCNMTRSMEATKLGIFYDQRCRAVTLKMADDYVDDLIDENKYDEEYIKGLPSFSLKAENVQEMQSWVESIR